MTAVPKFHTIIEGSDPNDPDFTRLLDKNNTKIGSDADAEKAMEKYFQWKSGKSGRFKGATNKTAAELAIMEKRLKDATVGNRQVVDTSAVTAAPPRQQYRPSQTVIDNQTRSELSLLARERQRGQDRVDLQNDPNYVAFGGRKNNSRKIAGK